MATPNLQAKAIEAMIAFNAAVRNVRLYPTTSKTTREAIEKALRIMSSVLKKTDAIVFAESERELLVMESPLGEKDRERPQVVAFLELMFNFGIKTIAFKKGLRMADLTPFFEIIGAHPAEIQAAGGIRKQMAARKIRHIDIDQKVYVSMEKGRPVSAAGGAVVKETFLPMIQALDGILDGENREQVAKSIAASIAQRDEEALGMVMTQPMDTSFGKGVFGHILTEMDDEKFERMLQRLHKLQGSIKKGEAVADVDEKAVSAAYRKMLDSEKGEKLKAELKRKEDEDRAQKEKQRLHIKNGVNSVARGEAEYLGDRLVMQQIPKTVDQLLEKGKTKTVETIVENLSRGLVSERPEARAAVSEALVTITASLEKADLPEIIQIIARQVSEWVKIEISVTPAYQTLGKLAVGEAARLIAEKEFSESAPLLEGFSMVAGGRLPKDAAVVEAVRSLLGEVTSEKALGALLDEFSTNAEGKRKDAAKTLVGLGEAAAWNLLGVLKESDDRSERSRILQLIPEMGQAALPAVLDQLDPQAAWYYVRNLVLLLGKVGDRSHVKLLEPFLHHKDFRVRREAVNAIFQVGGKEREKIFLNTLPTADDKLKIDLIGMLDALESEDAVPVFVEMLESKEVLGSKMKDELGVKICQALGNIGDPAAIAVLAAIGEQKKKGVLGAKPYGEEVKIAATKALGILSGAEQKPKRKKLSTKERHKKAIEPNISPQEKEAQEKALATQEQNLKQLIDSGDTDGAVKLLADLTVSYAKLKNFPAADDAMERLQELDPMALIEIQKAGEVVDQEKSESIDKDYLDDWSDLYGQLTQEEANTLFFALREIRFSAGDVIFRQGAVNDRLYFVDVGEVGFNFHNNNETETIVTVGPGHIAGSDSFFGISVCTTTAEAVTDVVLNYIEKRRLKRWEEEMPALAPKVKDYCIRMKVVADALKEKELDRRRDPRYNLTGRGNYRALDDSGNPEGMEYGGEVTDISAGGFCFNTKAPRDYLNNLLLRRLGARFTINVGKSKLNLEQTVTVVSVNYVFENNYAVHVKLEKRLGSKLMEKIAAAGS